MLGQSGRQTSGLNTVHCPKHLLLWGSLPTSVLQFRPLQLSNLYRKAAKESKTGTIIKDPIYGRLGVS
jgi:hypothetical protein